MKKSIRPPENWQDFESLCKKLFGEVWDCSIKIKKNGRLGQPQAGVDIYAIPEGKSKYWGIQCKGKSNYNKANLTKSEIEAEINNAREFKPELETFIFCTTAVKDAKIEEFIRLKDIENRAKKSFEILLYSWEDIADFIEENRNTYNWYINNIQFKDKFNTDISFLGFDGKQIVKPKFERITKKYRPENSIEKRLESQLKPFINITKHSIELPQFLGGPKKINYSWCNFKTVIQNTGSSVLEDWKFFLHFDDNVRLIDDDFTNDFFQYEKLAKYRTTFASEKDRIIKYLPLNNSPLIQKDSKEFKSYFIPKVGCNEVIIKWKLLARDYSREDSITLKIEPEYELSEEYIWIEPWEEEYEETEIIEFIEVQSNSEEDT